VATGRKVSLTKCSACSVSAHGSDLYGPRYERSRGVWSIGAVLERCVEPVERPLPTQAAFISPLEHPDPSGALRYAELDNTPRSVRLPSCSGPYHPLMATVTRTNLVDDPDGSEHDVS
jgi:hypothetical protein